MKKQHVSVLLQEVIEGLNPKANQNYVDATLGFAGHAKEILKKTGPNGILVGIDQDREALEYAKEELAEFKARFRPFKGNFEEIIDAVGDLPITGGVIADLGVSSMQLDKENRGFSFQKEAPLDMRMNIDQKLTAKEIVNDYLENDLANIIYKYSDERFAKKIAKRICEKRQEKCIETTTELAQIVRDAIPRKFWPKEINPATRTFQAIRIAVNDELGVLERFLPEAVEKLEKGARIAIISFHSLEDKIVKDYFKKEANPCTCPPDFPKCICGQKPTIKIINKKAIIASLDEIKSNLRSRSAKLRIAEKI